MSRAEGSFFSFLKDYMIFMRIRYENDDEKDEEFMKSEHVVKKEAKRQA